MKRRLLEISLSITVICSIVLCGCGSNNKGNEVTISTEKEADSESVYKDIVLETEESTEVVIVNTMDNTEELEPETELEKNIGKNESRNNKSNDSVLSKTEGNITETDKSDNVGKNHEHTYVPVTTTVHHNAVTHQEDQGSYITVVDQEAYDFEEPVYEYCCYCKTCYNRGEIVKFNTQNELDSHRRCEFFSVNSDLL